LHWYGATSINDDNTCNDDGYSREKHNPTLNEHQMMISFPLLLRCMGIFIIVLIHFLPLVHKPLSSVIIGFL
jgi:hypothetical protein